jgi:hypothetical protein
LLRDNIAVISKDTLIISEEFSGWDSDPRIDLLGVDLKARLVVIELKRTTDDGHADLQALRYAAMVSNMTFDDAVETFRKYMNERKQEGDPRTELLKFLGWHDSQYGIFADDVRIVLAAPDFSPEVTSAVLWLNERDLDFSCMRIQPYRLRDTILLDVQQIIPLPEAAEFQVQLRQKQREARAATGQLVDRTRYDVTTADGIFQNLSKRNVMLTVCRFLVRSGISPEEFEDTVGKRIFESVDGDVDAAAVEATVIRNHPNDQRAGQRYLMDDNDLIRYSGRTYALTTQWSKESMEAAMSKLQIRYGSLRVSYRVSE